MTTSPDPYPKNTIVLDASIVLHATLDKDEETAKKIKSIRQKIITSPIFYLECANSIRSNYPDPAEANAILDSLLDQPITPVSLSKSDIKIILRMSVENQTTTYDSSYHHLAIEHNCTLITCDKRYYQKTSHLGHIELWG